MLRTTLLHAAGCSSSGNKAVLCRHCRWCLLQDLAPVYCTVVCNCVVGRLDSSEGVMGLGVMQVGLQL